MMIRTLKKKQKKNKNAITVLMKLLSKLLDKTTIAVENLTKELASDIAGVRDADNGGSFISVGVIIYAVKKKLR